MLSYRHAFHAGNFADVHKHVVLSVLIASLTRKDAPFCYLDTHAASGRHDLQGHEAQKKSEFAQGILRLWRQENIPDAVLPYIAAIQAVNPSGNSGEPRFYPGSPRLVRHFLRPQDRMILTELHPADFQQLRREFAGDRQVAVHHLDGYQALKAYLPPRERRGLVLIDPAYERRDEAVKTIAALQTAYKRWPQGVYALWFPVTNNGSLHKFYEMLAKSGIRKILGCELCVRPPLEARRLNGSLMVITNPPWHVDETLGKLQPWLAGILADSDYAAQRIQWLTTE